MALRLCVRRRLFCSNAETADHDSDFVAFADRAPGARIHLLLIPRHHVLNIRSLSAEDLPMLESMRTLGARLLRVHGVACDKQRLGFHISRAFERIAASSDAAAANSVEHLHLHLLARPWRGFRGAKYSRWAPWYISIDDAIATLGRGERVTFTSRRLAWRSDDGAGRLEAPEDAATTHTHTDAEPGPIGADRGNATEMRPLQSG